MRALGRRLYTLGQGLTEQEERDGVHLKPSGVGPKGAARYCVFQG